MLVEDSDDDAFFFERAFALAGVTAQLVRFVDGGEAVEYLQGASADHLDLSQTHILFLDLKLPVLSGFEVLRWIKERDLVIETVVLSGSDLETDIMAARELGAAAYLVKPITAPELKRRIEENGFAFHPGADVDER